MAKIYLDKLRKKYKGVQVTGTVYSDLIKQILESNTEILSNKVLKISDERFKTQAKKYRAREIRLALPDISDLYPKRNVHVKKVAEKGKLLQDTLRDRISISLRDRLNTFSEKTGEQAFVTRRGAKAGRINKTLLIGFEKDLTEIFSNYTKKDKRFGVPNNIHTIAVTETRSTINEIKGIYTKELLEKNPNLQCKKKWVHNRSLSKEPRKGHEKIDGIMVKFSANFKVPKYKKIKGRMVKAGVDLMEYPHDPKAPADQVIGCNCDYDLIMVKEPKTLKRKN